MNASNASSTDPDSEIDVVYFTIKAVICVITVLGNALVIFLIFTCRRLRVLPNTFIVALAVADMLVGAIITPTEAVCKYWYGNCVLLRQRLTYDILYHLSVTNLCALTLDRYIATERPLQYVSIMSRTKVIVILVLAWVSAAVTPVTAYIMVLNGMNIEALQIIDLVLLQILPSVMLGIVYVRMTYVLTKLKKKEMQQINQVFFNYGEHEQRRAKTTATVKMTGALIIVFILCYVLAVTRRLYYFCLNKDIPYPVVLRLSRTLLNLNSAINVFVYAFMKGDFKRELRNKCICLSSSSNNDGLHYDQVALRIL